MKNFFQKTGERARKVWLILKELFWRRKIFVIFIYTGLAFNILSWFLLWRLAGLNQEIIILHYNAYLGIDTMLGSSDQQFPNLFIAAFSGVIILLLNIIFATILLYFSDNFCTERKRENTVDVNLLGSEIVIAGSFLIQVAILIYAIALSFVNN